MPKWPKSNLKANISVNGFMFQIILNYNCVCTGSPGRCWAERPEGRQEGHGQDGQQDQVGHSRREGKWCSYWLGDVHECRTNHLAARMIWTKVFGRTSILVRWWFDMVWTGCSSIFPKHPFRQVLYSTVAVILSILYFNSSWWKIASAARIEANPSPEQ